MNNLENENEILPEETEGNVENEVENIITSETEEAENNTEDLVEEVYEEDHMPPGLIPENIVEEKTEKPKKEKKSFSKFIWLSVIFIILASILVFSFADIPIVKKYRTNFIKNITLIDEKTGISDWFGNLINKRNDGDLKKKEENMARGTTYDNESYLYPFENAGNAVYTVVGNELVAAKSNYIAFFDDNGEKKWETATSVVNPIIDSEGDYVLIAENLGRKINLFSNKKLVFSVDAKNEILNVSVSSNGDVVVVTKKELYKGAIEVFNKKGECIFDWSSGAYTIVCADISPSSRKLAVGFLDTSEVVTANIQLFDINKSESYKTIEIPETVVYRLKYTGETLNVFGDNRFVGLNLKGEVVWDEVFEKEKLSAVSVADDGTKALLSENNNVPAIRIYSKDGSLKNEISVTEMPDFIDVTKNRIVYNSSRMINFGKHNETGLYPATMDIRDLIIINKKTFLVVYSNSIEFIKE